MPVLCQAYQFPHPSFMIYSLYLIPELPEGVDFVSSILSITGERLRPTFIMLVIERRTLSFDAPSQDSIISRWSSGIGTKYYK